LSYTPVERAHIVLISADRAS